MKLASPTTWWIVIVPIERLIEAAKRVFSISSRPDSGRSTGALGAVESTHWPGISFIFFLQLDNNSKMLRVVHLLLPISMVSLAQVADMDMNLREILTI